MEENKNCLSCKYATQSVSYCRCTISGEIYSKEEIKEFIRDIKDKAMHGCSLYESNQLEKE